MKNNTVGTFRLSECSDASQFSRSFVYKTIVKFTCSSKGGNTVYCWFMSLCLYTLMLLYIHCLLSSCSLIYPFLSKAEVGKHTSVYVKASGKQCLFSFFCFFNIVFLLGSDPRGARSKNICTSNWETHSCTCVQWWVLADTPRTYSHVKVIDTLLPVI